MKKLLLSVGLGIIDGLPLGGKVLDFFKEKRNKVGFNKIHNLSPSNDNKPDYTRLITNIVTIIGLIYLLAKDVPISKEMLNFLAKLLGL